MFLSCKCLNITIKIRDNSELKPIKMVNYRDNNFEPVSLQSPMPLTSSTSTPQATATLATVTPPKKIDSSKIAGEFFNHDLVALITTASTSSYEIIKQQQPLIYTKVVDNWTINYCVNCMMYTYALNDKLNSNKIIKNDDNDDDDNDICDNTEINNSDYNNYKLLINNKMILPTDNYKNNSNDNVDYYEKLKSHVNYSKIYNIIVNKKFDNLINNGDNNNDDDDNEDDDNDDEYNLLLNKRLSQSLKLTVNHLQQQYEIGYQNMKRLIDEKIQKFAAEQYEFLDEFKEHGHKEYRTLVNRICESNLMKTDDVSVTDDGITKLNITRKSELPINQAVLPTNGPTLPSVTSVLSTELSSFAAVLPTDNSRLPTDPSVLSTEMNKMQIFDGIEQDDSDSSILRYNKNETDKKMNKRGLKKKETKNFKNVEDEAIFPLEGMDDSDNVEVSEDEIDTDDSGQDEGIHIPRGQRGGHPTLAKSLPVSVPNFSFGRRIQDSDDDQLSMDPHDPHNIRASIKALAKSVHGDTVFGDLPRPRFSTQI